MSTIMGGVQLWGWACPHESQFGVVWALTEESAREQIRPHLLHPDLAGQNDRYLVLGRLDMSAPGVWVSGR